MSAITDTIESLENTYHFIDGLQIMRKYATEAFIIEITEIAIVSVHGCKPFSESDLQVLINMGWEAWTNKGKSGAEWDKLNYVDT